jgi:hypothetical protein
VDDAFELDLIQREAGELPHVGGFVGASQFWQVTGLIENKLPFHCRTVPTSHSLALGDVSTKGARFEVGRLLVGTPQLTHEHTAALLRKFSAARKDSDGNIQESVNVTAQECEPTSSDVVYEFTALIPGVKPLWSDQFTTIEKTNAYLGKTTHLERDTIMGSATDVEFSLIKRKPDMEVRMRYPAAASRFEAADETSSSLPYPRKSA